ncbi:MAG: anti-sigma factor domain-containing protein [Stellaceae bacterium]
MNPLLASETRRWRAVAAVLTVAVLALIVAAAIARPAPDFADRPVLAVIRDGDARPVWTIRLAPAAHEIAATSLRAEMAPRSHGFELWLVPAGATAPRPLGMLPASGSQVIPLIPENAALLARRGTLLVTLEAAEGASDLRPSGAPLFRGHLRGMIN